jgi:hypothetical protein
MEEEDYQPDFDPEEFLNSPSVERITKSPVTKPDSTASKTSLKTPSRAKKTVGAPYRQRKPPKKFSQPPESIPPTTVNASNARHPPTRTPKPNHAPTSRTAISTASTPQTISSTSTPVSSPPPAALPTASKMSSDHLSTYGTNNIFTTHNIWAEASYAPPRGPCAHKTSLLNPACACLRFMLHPLKAATSFLCDGCGHHACFHKMESAESERVSENVNRISRVSGARNLLRITEATDMDAGRGHAEGQERAGAKRKRTTGTPKD